ncbi:Hypothetical predicted protein, partial [Marmota monax]
TCWWRKARRSTRDRRSKDNDGLRGSPGVGLPLGPGARLLLPGFQLLLRGFQLLLRGFQLPSTPLAHGAPGPTLPLSELQEPVASGLPECVWLLCELRASQ